MEARLFYRNGTVENLTVDGHYKFVQQCLALLTSERGGDVYRAQLVDEFAGVIKFDTYDAFLEPAVGQVVFAGVAS